MPDGDTRSICGFRRWEALRPQLEREDQRLDLGPTCQGGPSSGSAIGEQSGGPLLQRVAGEELPDLVVDAGLRRPDVAQAGHLDVLDLVALSLVFVAVLPCERGR